MVVYPQSIIIPNTKSYDSIWPMGSSALQAGIQEIPLARRDTPGELSPEEREAQHGI